MADLAGFPDCKELGGLNKARKEPRKLLGSFEIAVSMAGADYRSGQAREG